MPLDRPTFIQQLRYWQGQALLSRDLNDQAAYDALLRAWHNRALHALDNGSLYGVYEGLDTLLPGTGRVEVAPGLAYDATGRVLLLRTPASLPLPGRIPRGGLILVLSGPRPVRDCEVERPSGACLPGQSPAEPRATLHWVPATQFEPCDGVALGHLTAAGDLRPPPYATRILPLARPRTGNGATIPGSTAWNLWLRKKYVEVDQEIGPIFREVTDTGGVVGEEFNGETDFTESGTGGATGEMFATMGFFAAPGEAAQPARIELTQVLGLQVTVDTSAAGFTRTPCYQAWLEGGLWNPDLIEQLSKQPQQGTSTGLAGILSSFWLLQMVELRFGHVYQPTATGFTYRIWFPRVVRWTGPEIMPTYLPLLQQYLLQLAQHGNLAVSWVGVQEAAATQPSDELDPDDLGDCHGTA